MLFEVKYCGIERPRARLSNGDLLKICLNGNLCLIAKVLEKSVMYGFASLVIVYEPLAPDDIKAKDFLANIHSVDLLLGPLLVDVDVVRTGLMEKIGKSTVLDSELARVRMITPPDEDANHPLGAHLDHALGSYVLGDRLRQNDYVVDWRGEKSRPLDGEKLGLWGVVPNADRLAETIEATLNARNPR